MGARYEVGYGKPPRHSQFKSGESGNPNGRPKGARNLATDLKEELEEKIVVTEGGKSHETTKQRAMIKSLLSKALKGDTRAASVLVNLKVGLDALESARSEGHELSEDDQAVLDAFKSQILQQIQSEKGGK